MLTGAPADFDFLAALRDATSIRVAMAFGHMTGWRRIEAVVLQSAAREIFILLGQAFFQTEPKLLALLLARERLGVSPYPCKAGELCVDLSSEGMDH